MKLINADELIKSLNSRIETRTETMNQATDPAGYERNEAVIMAYQGIIKQIERMNDNRTMVQHTADGKTIYSADNGKTWQALQAGETITI